MSSTGIETDARGSATESSADALGIYRRSLRAAAPRICRRGGRDFRVQWRGKAGDDPESLVEALEALESGRHTPQRIYSRGERTTVLRMEFEGRPLILKRFHLPSLRERVKYAVRASRAHRAWATARALDEIGIDAPNAPGFIDVRSASLPEASYLFLEFLEGAVPCRRWIKAWLHQREDDFRERFGRDLAGRLRDLYHRGIYHADTKTSNILVRDPEQPDLRRFYWIELESFRFGIPPTQKRILRNLVQINGSIGSKLSDTDRLAFLGYLSDVAPWAMNPGVADRIRARTLQRLNRELRGECGP